VIILFQDVREWKWKRISAVPALTARLSDEFICPLLQKNRNHPRIKRIVVCDLTDKTEGNADGVGLADFVIQRLVDKID